MANKKTKAEFFNELREMVMDSEVPEEKKEELVVFIDKELELLAHRAAKEKERAECQKRQGDALRDMVCNALTEDFCAIEEIMAALPAEVETTKSKVVARLTQLVKMELAEKAPIKNDEGKRVMAYRSLVESAETPTQDETEEPW